MTVAGIDSRDALKIFLPHGKEALIKDLCITVLVPGVSATGHIRFPSRSEYFQGHFPDSPCLPSHIVLEIAHEVMQVAILSALTGEQRSKLWPLCWGWDELRFRDQILPNEIFKMVVQIIDPKPLLVLTQGIKAIEGLCLGYKVGGEKIIFEGTVYFSLVPKKKIKSSGV